MKKITLALGLLALTICSFAQTPLLSEDFSNGIPSTWSQSMVTGSNGWTIATSYSSQYWNIPTGDGQFAVSNDDACNCDMSADRLITPKLDLTGLSNVFMSFDAYYDSLYFSQASIELSLDSGITWTTILNLQAGLSGWQKNLALDLSSYTGNANVWIAFKHNDMGDWADGFAIDNVNIVSAATNDVALVSIDMPDYVVANENTAVSVEVFNYGTSTITSLDLTWNDGTNFYIDNISGLSIPYFGSAVITHNDPLNMPIGLATIQVSAGLTGDTNLANNALSKDLEAALFIPTNHVVFEEGTGTWCGWCPRGAVAMEYMENTYDNFIGIAVHNGDPMVLPAYNSGAGITGFPGMNVDRTLMGQGVSTASMENFYLDRVDDLVVADVKILSNWINANTGDIQVEVQARFNEAISGNYRFAVVVVEDSVTGSSGQYAQANYYSGGSSGVLSGAGHDWHLSPDPVPAHSMVYDHVGRQLIGGYSGEAGSVPATVNAGDSVSHTFVSNIGNTVNFYENVSLVALLLNPQGRIVNASHEHAHMTVGVEEAVNNFRVFPNPSNGIVNVNLDLVQSDAVTIQVLNQLGQVLIEEAIEMNKGTNFLQYDLSSLPNGVYNISILSENKSITERLIIQ